MSVLKKGKHSPNPQNGDGTPHERSRTRGTAVLTIGTVASLGFIGLGAVGIASANATPAPASSITGSGTWTGVCSSKNADGYAQVNLTASFSGAQIGQEYDIGLRATATSPNNTVQVEPDASGKLVWSGPIAVSPRFKPGNSVLTVVELSGSYPVVFTGTATGKDGADCPTSPPPPTTRTVHVKQSTLDQGCGAGQCAVGAHFVVTQIGNDAPASISVTLSDKSVHTVSLLKVSGGTAHYQLSFNQGLKVTDATAVVPSGWSGQFNLSHYLCEKKAPPSPHNPKLSTVSSCISSNGKATVGITNENSATVKEYTIQAVQNGKVVDTKTVSNVAGHATVKVTLSGLKPGEVIFKVTGSDGTHAETCPKLPACAPNLKTVTPYLDVTVVSCTSQNLSGSPFTGQTGVEFVNVKTGDVVSAKTVTELPGNKQAFRAEPLKGYKFSSGAKTYYVLDNTQFDFSKCSKPTPPAESKPSATVSTVCDSGAHPSEAGVGFTNSNSASATKSAPFTDVISQDGKAIYTQTHTVKPGDTFHGVLGPVQAGGTYQVEITADGNVLVKEAVTLKCELPTTPSTTTPAPTSASATTSAEVAPGISTSATPAQPQFAATSLAAPAPSKVLWYLLIVIGVAGLLVVCIYGYRVQTSRR